MRPVFLTVAFLACTGCSQVFNSNAYSSFDKLNVGDLSSLSVDDINTLSKDPAFYQQLRDNPSDLEKVQANLEKTIDSTTASNQDKVNAASTYITVTANSTTVVDVQTNAVNNIPSIKDALSSSPPNYGKALKIFMGNQSEAEMETTLGTLTSLAGVYEKMELVAAKSDGTVDETLFFSGTTDVTNFAETAFMSAVAQALVTDKGGISATATELAKDNPDFSGNTTDIDALNNAKTTDMTINASRGAPSTSYSTGYPYAYLYAANNKMSGLL